MRLRIELRLVIWSFLHRKSACTVLWRKKSGNCDIELVLKNCQYEENPRIIVLVHCCQRRGTIARQDCRSAENIKQKYLHTARISTSSYPYHPHSRDSFTSFNSVLFLQTRVLSRAFLRFSKSEDKIGTFNLYYRRTVSNLKQELKSWIARNRNNGYFTTKYPIESILENSRSNYLVCNKPTNSQNINLSDNYGKELTRLQHNVHK